MIQLLGLFFVLNNGSSNFWLEKGLIQLSGGHFICKITTMEKCEIFENRSLVFVLVMW